MSNVQWQRCLFENHNEQQICGVCLDGNCQNPTKLCCFNCVKLLHKNHMDNVLDIKLFEEWFQNSLQYENQISDLVDKWQKDIAYQFTQLRKALLLQNHIEHFENFSQLGFEEFNKQIKSLINIKATYDRLNNDKLKKIFNSVIDTLNKVVSLLQNTNMQATIFIKKLNEMGSQSRTLQPYTMTQDNILLIKQTSIPQTQQEKLASNINFLQSLIIEAASKQQESNKKENFFTYGIDLVLKGKYSQALPILKQSSAKENVKEVSYWIVISLQSIRQYKESIEKCNEILKSDQSLYKIWLLLGIGLTREKKYDEALEAIRKYLNQKPTCFIGQTQAGIILFELQKFDLAQQLINLALSQNVACIDALFYSGLILERQGQIQQAKQKFQSVQYLDQQSFYSNYINDFFKKYS